MLDRVTNFHRGSFLFIFILLITYFTAIYLDNFLYLTATSIVFDAFLFLFLFFRVKNSRNLNSYWLYIVLGVAAWVVADVLWMFYDDLDFSENNISRRSFMQILYLMPFIMFLTAFVMLFVRILKRMIWQQVVVDMLVIVFVASSFFWFAVFNMNFAVILNKEYLLNLAYIVMDICMFCMIFVTFFSINFRKRHISLLLYLLSMLIISICDTYYSTRDYFGLEPTDVHYDVFFKVAFFIIFIASLHLVENEGNIKIRLHRIDFQMVLIEKVAILLIVSCIALGLAGTGKIYSIWIAFLLMTLLVYAAITYNISYSENTKKLARKEKIIIAKLDDEIRESIRELEEKNQRLKQLSEFDSLTGLLNRKAFLDKLTEMIKTKALGEKIDTYSIDINHFKVINDTYGHYVGDEVLLNLSKKIKAILPEGAIISRFGGDDFMIVLKQKEDGHFREFLYYLLKVIAEQIVVGDYKIGLGAKIGISSTQTSEIMADDLIMQAGAALDAAKKDANTKYVFYDDIKEQIQERNYIEILLNSINFDDEFSLNFQPQYLLNGKKIIGAEALIRWNSPVKGFVSPAKFIPIAEQSSIINSIGTWVAREAIRQMSYWNKKYGISLKIGINISPKQVDNINFSSDILNYVNEYGIDPKCIDVELTEASLVNAEEIMQTVLAEFSQNKMSISIDDFGTGFSSMNYIKKYPLDRLKIAKELVDNIATNEIDRDVVKSVITFAKNIGLKTIAEGVEDETQLEILRELGCDEIQGYFWGKPMNAKDFEELIKSSLV